MSTRPSFFFKSIFGVFAFLFCVAAMRGCGSPPAKPSAKPVIVDSKLNTHWFSDTTLTVTLRNDGNDGWIVVSYKATGTRTHPGDWGIKRRSGAEVWLRHNLTNADDSEHVFYSEPDTTYQIEEKWECCTLLKAGEQKAIDLKLCGHTSSDTPNGPFAEAVRSKPEYIDVK